MSRYFLPKIVKYVRIYFSKRGVSNGRRWIYTST